MSSVARVERALVSVFDKEGLVPFVSALADAGVTIVSTGGTATLLAGAGIAVEKVADVTGFPEMLDGRVKTLHPRIHGGILAVRTDAGHMKDIAAHGIAPIDLVIVNLYPFERTAADPDKALADVVEMIDVGGPSMVRAAAKNWEHVGVVVDPADYPAVLVALRAGGLPRDLRRTLAAKAFAATAAYDTAIARYLADSAAEPSTETAPPPRLTLDLPKTLDLVYGENPHQRAAFYREPHAGAGTIAAARALHGKPLSFNNILDFDAALALAGDLAPSGCVIVKHGNPCGVGVGSTAAEAFSRALATDPTSAFGGVIAFGREVDEPAARTIAEAFYEGVAAPSFSPAAIEALTRKKNLRLLETGPVDAGRPAGLDLRRVRGGLLAQEWDGPDAPVREGRVVSRRAPDTREWEALELAWTVVRHVKSNAIVLADATGTLGVGAGQMSRVDSVRLAVQKSQAPLAGAAMASDAFFPFRDGVDAAADAGVTCVVHPGGSIRDAEVVAAADERGLAMVVVGRRHFRH